MANGRMAGLGVVLLAIAAAGPLCAACTTHGPLTPGPSGPGLVEMLARETADAAAPADAATGPR